MRFIFDFLAGHSSWVTLMAEDEFVKILLVVNLANNLGKTLGCSRVRAVRLHRADA